MKNCFLNIPKNEYVPTMKGLLELRKEFLVLNSPEEITQEQRTIYSALVNIFPPRFPLIPICTHIFTQIEKEKVDTDEAITAIIEKSYDDLEVFLVQKSPS